MKPIHVLQNCIMAAAIGCAALGGLAAQAATIVWTNAISGGWDAAANWNPNSVPGGGDTAIITNAGLTVSLNSSTTVGAVMLGATGAATTTLSLNSQTLSLNGPLTVNSGGSFTVDSGHLTGNNNAVLSGSMTWAGGVLGGTLTLAADGTLNITGSNNHDLPNCTFTNNGTVVWSSGTLEGGGIPGTAIVNNGWWNAQTDQTINNYYGYQGTVFSNFGRFSKTGGAGTNQTLFAPGVGFNQLAGVVDVQSGATGLNLVLQGSGSFTGGYVTTNVSGLTYLSSGGFTINGTVTTTNVIEDAGNLVGANVIKGALTWQAGNWDNAASVTVALNSTLIVAGGTGVNDLANTVMTNNGTVVWASGTIEGGGGNLSPGTSIYNYGLWLATSDQTINDYFGYNAVTFNNYGTFRKTGGTGEFAAATVFASGVTFNQLAGVVGVQNGAHGLQITFQGGGNFTGGSFATESLGLATLSVGYFNINGTVTTTNVWENGANLAGANVVNGGLTWQAGNWNNAASVSVATNSTLVVAGGAGVNDLANTVMTNNGTVVWISGTIEGGGGDLSPGTSIYNYGLWLALGDQTINNHYTYNNVVFNNFGTFRKTGGNGTNQTLFTSGVGFNQLAGVIDVQNGLNGLNLVLQNGGSFTGGYITTNGAGLTYLSSGGFTINGTVTPTNLIENAGNLAGTNVINGGLTWQAGNWDNAASVTIATNSRLIVAGGTGVNDLANTVVTNNGTVVWASGTIEGGGNNLFPGTSIYNYGLWLAQSDQTFDNVFGYNSTVFNNYGMFRKTGGTGTNQTLFTSGVAFNQLAGVIDVQNGVNGLNLILQNGGSFTGGYVTTNVAGLTYLSSGSFTINGTVTAANLIENAGNLAGTNVINGALTWQAGNWNYAASVTVATNSTLIVAGGAGVNDMANTVVVNNGTVAWASGTIEGGGGNLNPGTSIYNYGLWLAQSDQTFDNVFGYNATVFNNYGTFRKTGGTGTNQTLFLPGVAFNQLAGVIDVQTGLNGLNLALQSGGRFTGGYITTNGAGLTYLSSGSFTINGTVTPTNLIENAANLAGSNVITGGLTWQAGVWNNAASVTIATNSTLVVAGGFGYNDMANTVVINNGTVQWESGTIRGGGGNLSPGTLIVNHGLWLANAGHVINNYFGYNNTIFDNPGTFRNVGLSNGVTEIDVEFDTAGLLDVQAGIVWNHGPVDYQGIVNFGISSGANYGHIWADNPEAIQGALSINLINGYASLADFGIGPNGGMPTLISWPADSTYYTITGFGTPPLTNMPAGETWGAFYSNTGIYLELLSIKPQFAAVSVAGTNLVFTGAGGSPGTNYVVLASTNLMLPLANWIPLATNEFDDNGQFNFTNPVNAGKPKQFFTFKMP